MQKKFTSQEQRNQFIQEWQESSLSQKAFAEKHGINYGTFHSWVKKKGQDVKFEKPGFVPISITSTCFPSEAKVELTFSSGAKLSFSYQPDPAYLQSLLRL